MNKALFKSKGVYLRKTADITTMYKALLTKQHQNLMANFVQILLVVLLVGSLRIILGNQGIPVSFTGLDQVMDNFPHGFLLVVVTFAAAGDESVRDHILQGFAIFIALAFIEETVHVVGGEPLVGQNGIYVDVVVLGSVVVTSGEGNCQEGAENEHTLHLD